MKSNKLILFILFASFFASCDSELEIDPKPETLFRVFMIYKPCNQDFKVKEQELPTFQRKGFTVVEWGGMELSNNCLSDR